MVALKHAPGRLVVAAAKPKASRGSLKKHERIKTGDAMVVSAPSATPVPSLLLPVRRLGISLQHRLVQAGVVKLCANASATGRDGCVRPASDG